MRKRIKDHHKIELGTIDKENFEYLNSSEELTEFEFNGTIWKLKLADLSEIRMSVYVYFDVKLFKGNKMLQSGEMQLSEKYFVPVSPNKKFIYVPFRGGAELINLETEEKLISSINWFSGNIYNESSTKMIINGTKEFKIIDLLDMKEISHVSKGKDYNNDAFFKDDDTIWQIRNNKEIEELNLETNGKRLISIKSPFDKFGISTEKYRPLIEKKTHCLALPEGGMAYSGNLNNWNFVNTKSKIVFETLIPTSEIKYSKGYERDYCNVEYKYVEIKKEQGNQQSI